jgi:hypothetical protein
LNSHCLLSQEGARVLEEDLKIRTDLDLRGEGEDCQVVLHPGRVRYVNLPVMSYDSIAVSENGRAYRSVFNLLSYPESYPIYMHCWGGADRTGTLAFLIGALLGMSAEDLAMDYELTTLSIWGERLRTSDVYQDLLTTLRQYAAPGAPLQSQAEGYLRRIGVSDEAVHAIRALLIE